MKNDELLKEARKSVCYEANVLMLGHEQEERRIFLKHLVERIDAVLAQPAPQTRGLPLIAVAGQLEVTIADVMHRCDVWLAAEQSKVRPDNALIALLCDCIRLAREYADYATVNPQTIPIQQKLILLPCPFCGADPIVTEDASENKRVICNNCGACTAEKGMLEKAVSAWNRRAYVRHNLLAEVEVEP